MVVATAPSTAAKMTMPSACRRISVGYQLVRVAAAAQLASRASRIGMTRSRAGRRVRLRNRAISMPAPAIAPSSDAPR